MAKKKKPPEHENLERWLVSYADFITLLFATFVVLYALSQVDITEYIKLEEAMKSAFSPTSFMESMDSIMDSSSSNSPDDAKSADSIVSPLMLEYMSPAYEQRSYEEIDKEIKDATKKGELDGVKSEITDKGLLITFNEDMIFNPGSATLTPKALATLNKVGVMITEKFVLHYIRVEGHTDNSPIMSFVFPSNWELSSARSSAIIRHLIGQFKLMPGLFTAVGYGDTRPLGDNKTQAGKAKNRRVEILILRNKFKQMENPQIDLLKMSKAEQEKFQAERMHTIKRLKGLSEAAKNLAEGDLDAEKNAIMMKDRATETMQLNPGNKMLYNQDLAPVKVIDSKTFDIDFQED